MSYTLMILGMAVVTAFVKAALFIAGNRIAFPPLIREALNFVPVTVLTAIIVPMVLVPGGETVQLTWRNPHLIGAVAAVLICLLSRHQLVTIIGSLAVFFAWQFLVLG